MAQSMKLLIDNSNLTDYSFSSLSEACEDKKSTSSSHGCRKGRYMSRKLAGMASHFKPSTEDGL